MAVDRSERSDIILFPQSSTDVDVLGVLIFVLLRAQNRPRSSAVERAIRSRETSDGNTSGFNRGEGPGSNAGEDVFDVFQSGFSTGY